MVKHKTTTLPYYIKTVVNEDQKTTLHLLHSHAIDVKVVFLCFGPALFLYFLQAHPYLSLIVTKTFYP